MIANRGAAALFDGLLAEAQAGLGDVVALRRSLHIHPELGLQLPRTQAAVLDALDGLDVACSTGSMTSSVVAVLTGQRPGPTTLLRADMDALPMPEATGLPYASEIEGTMHACGHDAHTAMLVGAARLLVARRDELAGRVVFMFQPGEEGHGGASVMLREGLLERHGPVDRAFAIHVEPRLTSGRVAGRSGTLAASSDAFEVVIGGKGGHASRPHDAIDPVPVACEIVLALQAMITRRIPAFDPAVLTVGSIQAGTTPTVVPETASLALTIRAVSEASRTQALDGLRRVVEHVASAHLCGSEVRTSRLGYPVTVNEPRQAEHALAVAETLLGPERVERMPTPIMGAEDWSFVLQQVPGSMVLLGVAPAGAIELFSTHSNRMVLDETAMATGVALHAAVALSPMA